MKQFIVAMVLIAVSVALVSLGGCTSAQRSKLGALGGSQHVILYACDGHIIGQWDTNGTIHNEEYSDGFYFTDKATGKLVRLTGTTVVTQN